MIIDKLMNPGSIVVVGGSDDLLKPGGKILKNIIDGEYKGDLFAVNPKQDIIQGVKSYRDLNDIPAVDLAILAIPSKYCYQVVDILVRDKGTRAFIIISAGFSEAGEEGKRMEKEIAGLIDDAGGCLYHHPGRRRNR